MPEKSHYQVTCLCGAKLTPHETESECPACHRKIIIEWQAKVAPARKAAGA